MHLAAEKIYILVVGREASTLSTLHGIVVYRKSGTRDPGRLQVGLRDPKMSRRDPGPPE